MDIFDVPKLATDLAPLLSPEPALSANAEMVVHTETRTPQVPQENKDQTADYNLARETIRGVLTRAMTALDGIMAVADEAEQARSYEVAANMMKHISDISKDLMSIHKSVHEIRPKTDLPPAGATNIIDKAVFVGSPADLLDSVKYRDKS